MQQQIRIGSGYDVHQLVAGRPLILGGIHIPHHKGCLGHSDADVLLHAISDALLGALSLGDIGKHFPDTSDMFKDADSSLLLEQVVKMVHQHGFSIGNIDATLMLQQPKIRPYIDQMRQHIAHIIQIDTDEVSVKATTTEHMGFEGREEGVSAQAICILLPTTKA